MNKRTILFFFLLVYASFLGAQVHDSGNRFSSSPFFLEAAYGKGMVNGHYTKNAVFFNAGYGPFVATARFCRSGIFPAQYIFENAFLCGYRLAFANYFRSTFSAGYSDLAFEKSGLHAEDNYDPSFFIKAKGLSLEAEAEWVIPFQGHASAWSITGMYYSTFNAQQNLNGFAAGLKFTPQRLRRSAFQMHPDSVEVKEKKVHEPVDAHNYLRTGLTGLIYEPHVSYSHFFNERRGFTVTAAYRVYSVLLGMEFSTNPDLALHGPAAYYGYDFLIPGKGRKEIMLSLIGGLRSLYFDRQWVGYGGTDDEPNWNISRSRQDLVLLGRMGFIHISPFHFAQSIFIDAGPRFSYYKTTFYGNRNLGQNSSPDAGFGWPENGFHVGAEFHLKIEIGGAW